MSPSLPVNTEGDEDSGGEIVAQRSDEHQDLTAQVAGPPLGSKGLNELN